MAACLGLRASLSFYSFVFSFPLYPDKIASCALMLPSTISSGESVAGILVSFHFV